MREVLAALSHEQWSGWTKYMLNNLDSVHMAGWRRQIATPYSELSEKEKDSDRVEADKTLALPAKGWVRIEDGKCPVENATAEDCKQCDDSPCLKKVPATIGEVLDGKAARG